jgi:hypothetical protein
MRRAYGPSLIGREYPKVNEIVLWTAIANVLRERKGARTEVVAFYIRPVLQLQYESTAI